MPFSELPEKISLMRAVEWNLVLSKTGKKKNHHVIEKGGNCFFTFNEG